MSLQAALAEKIERAFARRVKPGQAILSGEVWQLDSDVEEALWFSGRDWRELTWQDWLEHQNAVFFFSPKAFAYYLPSLLLLSMQDRDHPLMAADSVIHELDRTPNQEGWSEGFASRFLELTCEELNALKDWLLQVCEYPAYQRWGVAASGPGDAFGRAFDTVDLLQKAFAQNSARSGQTSDPNP